METKVGIQGPMEQQKQSPKLASKPPPPAKSTSINTEAQYVQQAMAFLVKTVISVNQILLREPKCCMTSYCC